MTKNLFIGGLLTALLASVGCGSAKPESAEKKQFTESLSRLQALKKQAVQQPGSRVVQQAVQTAENEVKYVEVEFNRSYDPIYRTSRLNYLDKLVNELQAAIGYRETSAKLRAKIQGELEPASKNNPRALYHLNQAKLDLDLFDECGPSKEFIDQPQNHVTFVKRVLENPQAEPVGSDTAVVRARDQMYFEGNVTDHAGDSLVVKAHLQQVSLYLNSYRNRAKEKGGYEVVRLIQLELERVWDLRRGIQPEKKLDKRVEVIERLVKVKEKMANHAADNDVTLDKLMKEIEQRCVNQAVGDLYEEGFKELFYGVDRLEDAYFRLFGDK